MAEIVNRFETATESLRHSSNTKDENTPNASLMERSTIENNNMDQSEDDNYYQFKTAVDKTNDDKSNDDYEDEYEDVIDIHTKKQGKISFRFISLKISFSH